MPFSVSWKFFFGSSPWGNIVEHWKIKDDILHFGCLFVTYIWVFSRGYWDKYAIPIKDEWKRQLLHICSQKSGLFKRTNFRPAFYHQISSSSFLQRIWKFVYDWANACIKHSLCFDPLQSECLSNPMFSNNRSQMFKIKGRVLVKSGKKNVVLINTDVWKRLFLEVSFHSVNWEFELDQILVRDRC